jgi:polysaccharide export outer membrane protein
MRNVLFKIIPISVLLVLFSGCSLKDYKLFQVEEKKVDVITKVSKEAYAKELAYENKVAANDRVSITVYIQSGKGSQQMTSILTSQNTNNTNNVDDIGILVTQNGTVRLPLIGSVQISGLTEDQASEKLISLYKLYIRNPYVTTEIKNQRVIVIGEVKKPGIVAVKNGTMTLIEAIAQSGDLTDYASRNDIKIIRGDLRNPTIRNIDLSNIMSLNDGSMLLKPNDIIYVQPTDLKGYNRAFNDIVPFWNMLSAILDPFTQRKELIQ